MTRDAIEIAELEDSDTQQQDYRLLDGVQLSTRVMLNQVIELGLIPQTSKHDLRGKPRVPRTEVSRMFEQKVSGIPVLGDRP
jgi:hypothetical protein